MISSIEIEGYRGFERFTMEGLGRLNLLVGTNNSGKTSALEALYLLTSQGDPYALWNVLWRRGERLPTALPNQELDVCHLFYGHETQVGSKFTLSAKNDSPNRFVSFIIGDIKPSKKQPTLMEEPTGLALLIRGDPTPPVAAIPLTRAGGLTAESFPSRRLRRRLPEGTSQFITSESLDSDNLIVLWNKVALTPDESLVMRALQFLDSSIERIASQAGPTNYYSGNRGGFIIKLKGREQPIPIGSMGDGIWRMLALAIAITQCRDGVLLVDEIDTGLHYSIMSDMWRLIFNAAKEFNVQVFATTHSYDCIQSLSSVCLSDKDEDNPVTLQRIEGGKSKSVPYSESEIVVASDREIEVR